MSIKVDTNIIIELDQDGETLVLVLTVEEARALKDELIRAVGAQNPPGYAPVLRPVGGFRNDTGPADHVMANGQKIPEHLLKRAEAARRVQLDTDGQPLVETEYCHCGDRGWGQNGCCGVSGCNNVPG